MKSLLNMVSHLADEILEHGDEGVDRHGHPKKLGGYRIEEILGKGSMGAVYKGEEISSSKIAAIKTLAVSGDYDPDKLHEVKERFLREAKIAGMLKHPNIVECYGHGHEYGFTYIVYEFLNGKDLAAHSSPEELLPMGEVFGIIRSIAEALDYAHAQNVIHRDIKPDNIIYCRNSMSAKLTDFGISRIVNESMTMTGDVLGTPYYCSPEQAKGMKIGGASDFFSLGVTMYELLCGQRPFSGRSLYELENNIVKGAVPDIRSINPNISQEISSLINRLLEKDETARLQSGRQLVDILIRYEEAPS